MRSTFAPAHPLPAQPAQTPQGQDSVTYNAWFHTKVHGALNNTRPAISHQQVMDEVQALIDRRAHN